MSSRNDQRNQVLDLQRQITQLKRDLERIKLAEHWTVLDIMDRLTVMHLATVSNVTDHFRGTAIDTSIWTWAGGAFTTPSTITFSNSRLQWGGGTSNARHFLYHSTIDSTDKTAYLQLTCNNDDNEVGIRFDDGTDDNYKEVFLNSHAAGTDIEFEIGTRDRVSAGVPTTTTSAARMMAPHGVILRAQVDGTAWSSWNLLPRIFMPWGLGAIAAKPNSAAGGNVSWTPTRIGLVSRWAASGPAAWNRAYFDWAKVT